MPIHRSCFLQLPWSAANVFQENPPQKSMNLGQMGVCENKTGER